MADAWTSDFISDFLELTEGIVSPEIFRKWGAVFAVAAALERRVWAPVGDYITFPNQYVFLVAHPGVGKYIVELVRELLFEAVEPGTKVKAFKIAPDNMTKATLLDNLGKSRQMSPLFVSPPVTYHSMAVVAEEIGVLLPEYDTEYIGALNKIYNNPELPYRESRRTSAVKELEIELPQLNILAGVQPGWLGSTFPEVAWTTGLTARIIMVYADEAPFKELYSVTPKRDAKRERVLAKLSHMSQLFGEMSRSQDASEFAADWHREGGPPVPEHSRLVHYNRRRTTLHLNKLATIFAVARSGALAIELCDVERAIAWLCEAEGTMPDVFRAMLGKSDAAVIEELHHFITRIWNRNGRKPVPGPQLLAFLLQRVPEDKARNLLLTCEKANYITRMGASIDLFIPRSRFERGTE